MNSAPNERREMDGIDILFLFWIMLMVLLWVSPALEESTGKARAVITETVLLTAVIIYLRIRKLPIAAICRWRRVPYHALPAFILFGLSGAILLDGLDRVVGLIIPLPPEMLEVFRADLASKTGMEKALVLTGVGIAAPFVEETLFRGAIQTTFERRSGVTKGVMMASLIFGLMHFQIAWLIQLLVMSVFLGWMAWRWNSIIPAVILHAANNLLSYSIMFEMSDPVKDIYLLNGQLNPIIALAAFAVAYLSLRGAATARTRQC